MKITRANFVIAKKTIRSLRLFVVLSRAVTIHDDCQKMNSLAHNLLKGKLTTECSKSQLNGNISTC